MPTERRPTWSRCSARTGIRPATIPCWAPRAGASAWAGELLLAQPNGDGYAADCLAAYGEGPVAVAIDGTTLGGRQVSTNAVSGGPAAWKRLAPTTTTPLILFLPAAG